MLGLVRNRNLHRRRYLRLKLLLFLRSRRAVAVIARRAKARVHQLLGVVIRHDPKPGRLLRREGRPVIVLVELARPLDREEVVDGVEGSERDAEAREEGRVVQLEERVGGIDHLAGADDEAADGGRPAGDPAGDDAPVEAMGEPVVGALRAVEVVEPDLLVADEEVVGDHDAHERREEDGEGAQDGDEGRRAVDELPGLDDPGGGEGDEGAAADVDVAGEDAGQVDAAGDGVAADVLEEDGESECEGEEEDAGSCAGGSAAVCEGGQFCFGLSVGKHETHCP